jgi:hypothetical protein
LKLLAFNFYFVLFAPFCGYINLQFSIPARPGNAIKNNPVRHLSGYG